MIETIIDGWNLSFIVNVAVGVTIGVFVGGLLNTIFWLIAGALNS